MQSDIYVKTMLDVDASPYGIGSVLTQYSASNELRVVSFASTALLPVEQRHSQLGGGLTAVCIIIGTYL